MSLFKANKTEVYCEPIRICCFYSNNYIKFKSSSDENQTLSIKKYIEEIKPYLKDIINNLKKPATWKIQLTIGINFLSSIDGNGDFASHSKSDNLKIMIVKETNKVIEEFFKLTLSRYQTGLINERQRLCFWLC